MGPECKGGPAKFGEKRSFGKLGVGDKNGKESEGRERRGGGGLGGSTLNGGKGGLGNLAMGADFYQRGVL